MDYTKQSITFKLKKGLRYLRLYGLSRTLAKIKAQYHMNRTYVDLPAIDKPKNAKSHVGLLGCGKFGYSNIAYFLSRNFGNVLSGVMDTDINKAVSLFEKYQADYYSNDAEKVIRDPNINLIFVASNHASHADYAIQAIKQGKAVHIEKPHAVSMDQLIRLCNAIELFNGKVRLGFNRPKSKLGKLITTYLNKEKGPAMLNWFVAGHKIEENHWYFAPEEGGRILGNLCHWTDLVYQMIPEKDRFPIRIIPTRAAKSDCDISVSFVFGDGSIGTITFSAKGHTFEGVRETLSAHKGNVLIELKDFQKLRIDILDKTIKKNLIFRDHGHQKAIVRSYQMHQRNEEGDSLKYIWETGYLALKVKEALETSEPLEIHSFEKSYKALSSASS